MIFLVVFMMPDRLRGAPDGSKSRRCVCRRVRTTSCGYVATEAVIFATAEQMRIVGAGTGRSWLCRSVLTAKRGVIRNYLNAGNFLLGGKS